MTPDQIKKAATDLADLERIESALEQIKAGSSFVLQVGQTAIYLDKSRSGNVTKALEAYLKGAKALLQQTLAPNIEGMEDPFDAVLSKLEDEARPQ